MRSAVPTAKRQTHVESIAPLVTHSSAPASAPRSAGRCGPCESCAEPGPAAVFVALRGGGATSSFPASRAGVAWESVFPPQMVDFMGVRVPMPNAPRRYLEAVYGPDWQEPNPNFRHAWGKSKREYAALG